MTSAKPIANPSGSGHPPSDTHGAEALLREAVVLADAALENRLPLVATPPSRLHEAMRYSVFAGGKRLRPALVLAACRAVGGHDHACAGAMAAVEVLHTYTLIHDDLPAMDDDDLRRGRPTCHKAFDEATAILAGDALQALAFLSAAEHGVEAVRALAHAAGSLGVVGGQQEDLDAEGAPHDAHRLERIHRGKTAALIRASCVLGALAGGATGAQRALLEAFGETIGLAFQVADDVLDATADAARLGKTPGKDAAQGKLTYVAVYGLAAAQAKAHALEREALAHLKALGPAAEPLAALGRFVVNRDH